MDSQQFEDHSMQTRSKPRKISAAQINDNEAVDHGDGRGNVMPAKAPTFRDTAQEAPVSLKLYLDDPERLELANSASPGTQKRPSVFFTESQTLRELESPRRDPQVSVVPVPPGMRSRAPRDLVIPAVYDEMTHGTSGSITRQYTRNPPSRTEPEPVSVQTRVQLYPHPRSEELRQRHVNSSTNRNSVASNVQGRSQSGLTEDQSMQIHSKRSLSYIPEYSFYW